MSDAGEEEGLTRLSFDGKLLRTKATAVELAKRVQALHDELASLEQGQVERTSVESVCKDLIATSLLHHKDKSVKAYLACCLADVLQLLAPDAPYTQNELRDIFQFMFRQLKNTSKPSDSHHAQYAYLLDSISKAKSACLMCELPNAEEQMQDAFRDFFDAIGPDTPATCAQCMADILAQLIDESTSVSPSIVELLLAQFQSKTTKLKAASHHLAVQVCQAASDRLQRYISQYFTDVFTSAHEQKIEGELEESYAELTKAHDLIIQLNKNVPALLLNVVPALEEELKTEDTHLREMAALALGKMFSDRAGMLDHLAKKHVVAWKSWLGRARDKSPIVRVAVLDCIPSIWAAHPELASDVQDTVLARFEDPEEKVRISACRIFKSVEYDAVLHHVKPALLKALADRIRDRKPGVSSEALHGLCRMYSLAYTDISEGDEKATETFGWIPEHVLMGWFTPDLNILTSIESAVFLNILPLPARAEDSTAWLDRFLTVYKSVSPKARIVLQRLAHLHDRRPTIYERYLQACEEYNGGIIDGDANAAKSKLNTTCQFLASTFPDAKRAHEDLVKFAKMNENRIYKLLRSMMDAQIDLKGILKNYAECNRRIEQSSVTIVDTFRIFVRRSANLFLNRTSISELLERIKHQVSAGQAESEEATLIADLLRIVAAGLPMAATHLVPDLLAILNANDMNEPILIDTALAMLASLSLLDSSRASITYDQQLRERLWQLTVDGARLQPKSAATILAKDEDQLHTASLSKELTNALPALEDTQFIGHLTALNRLIKLSKIPENRRQDVINYIQDTLLDLSGTPMEVDSYTWCTAENLPSIAKARIQGLKILCNFQRLSDIESIDQRYLKTLLSLLSNYEDQSVDPAQASHLRLQAAFSVLKLWTKPRLAASVIKHLFQPVTWIVQDPTCEVRHAFLTKTANYLSSRKITDPHCNLMLFVAALDPEPENIAIARQSISSRISRCTADMRLILFELIFVRLLHLIAHHPDFTRQEDEVGNAARYISFYLDLVASEENIGLLYHLALKMKTVRDAESQSHSESLYLLSEIAQTLVKDWAERKSWAIVTYPGSVKMPTDIFKALPSKEVLAEISKKVYLSADLARVVSANAATMRSKHSAQSNGAAKEGKGKSTKVRKGSPNQEEGKPKKPRTISNKTKTSKAPKQVKKKKKDWEGSSEDAEPDLSDSDAPTGMPVAEKPTRKSKRAKPLNARRVDTPEESAESE